MDLFRIAIDALFIFAVSLLAQSPTENPWTNWARGVNANFVKDGAAIKELQDQAVNTDGALRDAQRSLSVQNAALVKLVKALDEMPSTVTELRAKADEIARQQGQLQVTLDQVKSKQGEPPAESECIWSRVAAIAGGVSILLSLVLIGLVYQVMNSKLATINETGGVK